MQAYQIKNLITFSGAKFKYGKKLCQNYILNLKIFLLKFYKLRKPNKTVYSVIKDAYLNNKYLN